MGSMFQRLKLLLLLLAAAISSGCKTVPPPTGNGFSYFVGLDNFSAFTRSQNENGETVILSPEIKSEIPWNELIVSWNAAASTGTLLKIEACAISSNRTTKFYTLRSWSPDNKVFPRTSGRERHVASALLDGKTFVSERGGTWGRSHAMLEDLSREFKFSSSTNTAGLECYRTADGRIQFFLKENPERTVLHTVQVERNGFIHALLTGTSLENRGYQYFGDRAYSRWMEER